MKFRSTSPQGLVNNLHNYAYSRDDHLRQGFVDVFREKIVRADRGIAENGSDDTLYLTDSESLEFAAYRQFYLPGRTVSPPSDYLVIHRTLTQLDEIPPQLRHVIDPNVIELYDDTEPGDLNEVRKNIYIIQREEDGHVAIERDIRYNLRDIKHTIYKARESSSGKVLKVPVPTEDDTLFMSLEPKPEIIEDIGIQLQVGIDFCDYTIAEIDAMEANWLDVEIEDQIRCVNALMNGLISGRRIPQTL